MNKALFLLILLFSCSANASEIPDGWRLPTIAELSGNERNSSKTKYAQATADFNGDNKQDKVYILKSIKFNGEALFIHLSEGNKYKWVPLDIINWDQLVPNSNFSNLPPTMAVTTLKPETAKMYAKNSPLVGDDKPKAEDYENPSIDYFTFNNAASFFYWSLSEKKFIRLWYND